MKKKFEISTFSKIMIVVLAVLATLLIVVALMENAGYMCVYTSFGLMGTALMAWLAMIWGLISLYRKLKGRAMRLLVVMLGGTAIMIVSLYGSSYLTQVTVLGLESEYATVRSPEGDQVVVMRRVDTGMESEEAYNAMIARMDARYEYILANPTATPEPDPNATAAPEPTEAPASDSEEFQYPVGAFGYVYTAYPREFLLFYNTNADTEGVIYKGYESQAEIKFVWSEDGSVRFYLENPGAGDSGEIIVRK